MKRWLFLFLTLPAFAQNATVTANVKQLSGGAAQPTGASIRVDLQNCSAPRVPGTGNIGEKSRTFYPNTSGIATITLFSNTVIDCGSGVPATPVSFYTFNLVSSGQVTSLGSYKVPAGSSTLDTLTPINTVPVIPTPSGDTTYLRLDLSNFSNLVQPVPHWDITSLLTAGTATIPQINSVVYAGNYASLNAASAACPLGGGCTIEVNNTVTMSANLTLPSTTTLRFNQPGKVNLSGFTLTTGPVEAAAFSIFTNGSLTLSPLISRAPVEWFGAVGDWNGSTGTDNTVSINACLTDITAGQCVLQAKKYMISNVLSITRSNVGIRGQMRSVRSPTIYATPPASVLITTSTTANMINVFGTSTSNNLAFNEFNDFTLERTTTATSPSARGMQFNFTYGVRVEGVVVEDSPAGFFLHATGSQDLGGFINDVVAWGYAGFTETSGSYCGWCLDSSDGVSNPSLRIFGSGTFSALGSGVTTFGISSTGTALNDLHVDNFETSGVSYGEYMVAGASPLSALDIHFTDVVNDTCQISCMLFTTGSAPAAITVTGGWNFRAGSNAAPVIDLESASNVVISNVDIYYPVSGVGPAILVNGGHNNTIANSQFLGPGKNSAVSTTATSYINIIGNQMPDVVAGNVISLAATQHGNVSANNISGTGTNGIRLDAATQGIAGLASNAVNGSFTAAVTDLGINPLVPIYFQLNPGVAIKPTCAAPIEGMFWYIAGSGATNGTFQICQNQTGAFTWVTH